MSVTTKFIINSCKFRSPETEPALYALGYATDNVWY